MTFWPARRGFFVSIWGSQHLPIQVRKHALSMHESIWRLLNRSFNSDRLAALRYGRVRLWLKSLKAPLIIHTGLQPGESSRNRFNGFSSGCSENFFGLYRSVIYSEAQTVKTVPSICSPLITGLKPGVNERGTHRLLRQSRSALCFRPVSSAFDD